MADMLSVHQVTNVFERVGRTAGHQLLHRDQLRDFQVDAGGAVFGNGADDVAFSEHADGGIASVRTTSLTTSALMLLARISWAAMPTVSFMRTVATRAVFLRRMSPTCMATSIGEPRASSL